MTKEDLDLILAMQDDDFEKILHLFSADTPYFIQQFKDSGDIIGDSVSAYSDAEMKRFLDMLLPFVPNAHHQIGGFLR